MIASKIAFSAAVSLGALGCTFPESAEGSRETPKAPTAVVWSEASDTPVRGRVELMRIHDEGGVRGNVAALFSTDPLMVAAAPPPGTCAALANERAAPVGLLDAGEVVIAGGSRGQGIIVRPSEDHDYQAALDSSFLEDSSSYDLEVKGGAFGSLVASLVWPSRGSFDASLTKGSQGEILLAWPKTWETPRLALLDEKRNILAICHLAKTVDGRASISTTELDRLRASNLASVRFDFVISKILQASTGAPTMVDVHDLRDLKL